MNRLVSWLMFYALLFVSALDSFAAPEPESTEGKDEIFIRRKFAGIFKVTEV